MNVVVTGANRGLGLGLAKQYLQENHLVIAGVRNPEKANELKKLLQEFPKQLHIVSLDLSSDESIVSFTQEIHPLVSHIDILIHNAGLYVKHEHLNSLERSDFLDSFHANVFGPIMLSKAVFNLLKASKHARVVHMSSQMGSLTMHAPGSYSYRSSKAAVNMLTKVLADEVSSQQISVCSIHPGWVQTDMGGENAIVSVEESVEGIVEVIKNLTMEKTGKFFSWQGSEHPW